MRSWESDRGAGICMRKRRKVPRRSEGFLERHREAVRKQGEGATFVG